MPEADHQPRSSGQAFTPLTVAEIAPDFPELEIVALHGAGGMGAVYKARQPRLDRFVALKILPDEVAEDEESTVRFGREARAMASLSHPNIVPIFDFGTTERSGLAYFIMEFVGGTSLQNEIAAHGAMDVARATDLIGQICDGLEYAHTRGIVHRDITAANILLDADGRARIADFGLAKLQLDGGDAALTLRSTAMGTPLYMAPEQLRDSGTVDHRADLYSLGILFHQMLTGSPPQGAWIPASEKNPAVDKRFDATIRRAMQEDPARRFQSASSMREAVRAIAEPRRRMMALSLAAIALLAAGVSAFVLSRPERPAIFVETPIEATIEMPVETAFELPPPAHASGTPFFVRYDSGPDSPWFPELSGPLPDDVVHLTIAPLEPGAVTLVHADGTASEIVPEQPDTLVPIRGIPGPIYQSLDAHGRMFWLRDGTVTVDARSGWEGMRDKESRFTHFVAGEKYCIGRTTEGFKRFFVKDYAGFDPAAPELSGALLPSSLPGLAKLDAGRFPVLTLSTEGTLGFSEPSIIQGLFTPPHDLGPVADIAVAANTLLAVQRDGRVRVWGHGMSPEMIAEVESLQDVDRAVSGSGGSHPLAIRYGADKQWLVLSAKPRENPAIERATGEALRGCDFVALGLNFAAGIRAE